MKCADLIKALGRLKVETGSIVCLGCGHEHNCSTQGCALIREAIAELKFANNVKLSPDGKHAAFVQTSSDLKKNGYRNDIFLIDLSDDSVRQLTYNGKNASYIWESNDTLLLMTERTEDDKAEGLEEKTVFYRLNINGGEAAPAFAVAASVQGVWALGAGMFAFKVQTDWNRPDPEKVDKEICEEEKLVIADVNPSLMRGIREHFPLKVDRLEEFYVQLWEEKRQKKKSRR